MAKTKISEFSATPGNNTDIDGINLAEGCAPSGINDAIRELMAQLKDWQSGTSGDSFTIGSPGTLTYSSGTANGVAYLNGSKVLTTGSALVFDGTNLGIGTSSPGYKLDVRGIVAGGNGTIVGGISYSTRPEIGAISNHPVGFITNNTTQMLLDTSGNLGLGVTPSAWGSVWKVLEAGRTGNAFVSRSGGGRAILTSNTIFGASSDTYANTGAAAYFDIDSNSFKWYTAPSGTAGNAISFTQAMTLDASGNLLVGTTSGVSGNGAYGVFGNSSASGANRWAAFFGTNSSSASPAPNFGLTIGWNNSGGGGESNIVYGVSAGSAPALAFSSSNGTTVTERARIDSSGNLLVGKTSAAASSQNGCWLSNNGMISAVGSSSQGDTFNYFNSTAGAYRFYVNNAGTIFATNTTITSLSDQRLKENVKDLDVGLDAIMALKPRKFDWKEGKGKNIKGDRGWIAQEFEQVFPDMIDTWKDEAPEGEEPYKSVRAELIPVLVKAIQEQQAIIEQLKAQLTSVSADVAALKGA